MGEGVVKESVCGGGENCQRKECREVGFGLAGTQEEITVASRT